MSFLVAGLSGGLVGCTGVPSGIQPVDRFDVERYLGRWYEIARLDHSFERGLTHVTAEYSMRPDGRITVLNRGFDAKVGKWKQAKAVAKLRGASDVGSLKVTFFWLFPVGYHVIDLDHDEYRYAMVTGFNRSMFWILSRTPSLPKEVLDRLLARAGELGFATGELIFVEQAGDIPPPAAAGSWVVPPVMAGAHCTIWRPGGRVVRIARRSPGPRRPVAR